MSIANLMTRHCVQTAVYWGSPQEDGYGGKTYAAPVEILCRWEGKEQLVKGWDAKGNTFDYIGIVYVLRDLDKEGVLFLGTLADVTVEMTTNPLVNDNAYTIKQFEKLPALGSTTEFVRSAYLTQWQYR